MVTGMLRASPVRLALVAVAALVALPGLAEACLRLAQGRREVPQAEARPYQPVNGTGGFSVFGANALPGEPKSRGFP